MSRTDDHFERGEWWQSRSPNLYKTMLVEFNSGGANYVPVQQASTRRAAVTSAADSTLSLSTQSLQESMKQGAQVRPEKIAQASALLSDADYPSDAALSKLAGFLSNRI